ncbi:hypothetical protein [Polyangium sp. y55x31]|uniref:hypothetical protein n=1 Tax=Polyangium sp. y55x31 TaxID=3042688 RepID=UPI0024829559|nr:hypothetical protein [Polyangium sp. y55x31]MDI1476402.1 hypothetical protein [Polyangium sp. y55x31]
MHHDTIVTSIHGASVAIIGFELALPFARDDLADIRATPAGRQEEARAQRDEAHRRRTQGSLLQPRDTRHGSTFS